MLSEHKWDKIAKLESLLRKQCYVTKQLQSTDLTPSLFMKEWKNLIFGLSQKGRLIAGGIENSMVCRENLLLDNDILLVTTYIDPMYRILLSGEQIFGVKKSLYEVGLVII